ncbi:MAG: ATP synthase F1 subunit delta [Cyanobacteria bacterium J06632_22]
MSSGTVIGAIAEPYARALLSVAQSTSALDEMNGLAGSLLGLLSESSELSVFLASPVAEDEAKKGVLKRILGDDVSPAFKNFVLLLVDRGRVSLIAPILKQFQAMVREVNQTVLAEVTSAVELTDAQKETIRQKVLGMTGAQAADIETSIDPDLIGGVIIRVGSQVVDASLRGQLRRIGMQLGSSAA